MSCRVSGRDETQYFGLLIVVFVDRLTVCP